MAFFRDIVLYILSSEFINFYVAPRVSPWQAYVMEVIGVREERGKSTMPRLTILGLALVASASVFVNAAPTPGGGLLSGLLGPMLGGGKKDSDNSNDHRPYRDHRRECLTPYGHYDSNCEDEITKRDNVPGADNGNVAQLSAKNPYDDDTDIDIDIDQDGQTGNPAAALKKRQEKAGTNNANGVQGASTTAPAAAVAAGVPNGQLTQEEQYLLFREYVDDFDMAKRATPEEVAEAYNKIRGQSIGQSKEAAAAKAYQDRLDDWATKRSSISQ
ncbi:hypothetical protein VTP01DRAFT_221 [Rhizomucor pusillus]|uniref:uncharacterized protein n=1 Tax=Rhizomucor pusillus TaxID=4840 RepID=UPI003743B2FF